MCEALGLAQRLYQRPIDAPRAIDSASFGISLERERERREVEKRTRKKESEEKRL